MSHHQTVGVALVVGGGGGVAAVVGDLLVVVVEGVGGAPGGGVAVEGVHVGRVGAGPGRRVERRRFGVVLGEGGGAGALHVVGARVRVVGVVHQSLLIFHYDVVMVGVV